MATNISATDYVNFVTSKLGTPYVFGGKPKLGVLTTDRLNWLAKNYPSVFTSAYYAKAAKYVGQITCDCSGLVCWPWERIDWGTSQLYSSAYARLPMNQLNNFAPGTVLYKNGHVGIYTGKDSAGRPICVEEKGIDYGCVAGVITNPNRWSCGLTFSWIQYDITNPIPSSQITYKGKNPIPYPIDGYIRKGNIGERVKWLQWELVEAGFGFSFKYNNKTYKAVTIDSDFGEITEAAVKAFQQSCKIEVDGIVGPETKAKLVENSGSIFTDNRCPYQFLPRMVRKGCKGQDVGAVQWRLKNIYGYNIEVDLDFGPATFVAVKDFQSKCGLEVDGIVGPATKVALMAHDND